jgi:hypothetical protein
MAKCFSQGVVVRCQSPEESDTEEREDYQREEDYLDQIEDSFASVMDGDDEEED